MKLKELMSILILGLVNAGTPHIGGNVQKDGGHLPYDSYIGGDSGDMAALNKRLVQLEKEIKVVEANYGYGKVFAMHLQSEQTPVCPYGTFKLWDGYSLVKPFDGAGYIDLSDPGSCMRSFDPVPHVLCRGRKCKMRGNNWKSTWLWNRKEKSESSGDIMAGRCSVCESAKTLLVVHSQNETKPNCPAGYTSQYFWSGFSFISAGQSGKVSLSSIGSCLPYFESSPFIECDNNNSCRVVQASNVWLRVANQDRNRAATAKGASSRSKDTMSAREAWKKISRCRICALYTQSLWPRDRSVTGEDHSGFW